MNDWAVTDPDLPPTVSDRFGHISLAIDTVQKELHKQTLESLADDRTCRLALERLIEIISVASEHIPDQIKVVESQVDWRALSAIGVRLENTRERIEPQVLWKISRETFVPLRACAIGRTAKPA